MNIPDPTADWITQREVARLLGVSERTASLWARDGKLGSFEHGMQPCGRKKYSKALVERELNTRWNRALARQDQLPCATTRSESSQ